MKRLSLLALMLMVAAFSACEDNAGSQRTTGDPSSVGDTDQTQNDQQDGDNDTDQRPSQPDGTDPMPIEEVCDENGDCYCIRIAVIGTFDSEAHGSDSTAFVDWLNNDSSAKVDFFSESKPTIDAAFLSDYHVIIFAYQYANNVAWTYSSDEAAALRTWIEQGAGVVSTAGFDGMNTAVEVGAINSIMEPATGLSYNNDKYLAEQAKTDDAYCYENAAYVDDWDPDHPISKDIERVAAFWGSSINVPADGHTIATKTTGEASVTNVAAAGVELGAGRAFAYADEWPLLSHVWMEGQDHSEIPDDQLQHQDCYDMEAEEWKDPDIFFQHPQFWYNVIKWVAPENQCFIIEHPMIIIE